MKQERILENINIFRINEVFAQSKYTKTEVAKSCGLTRPTLDGLLRGADVKISTLAAWASFFNKPIAYFLNDVNAGSINTNSDMVLTERIKALEALIKEKDERISDLRDLLNIKRGDQ